MPVVPYGAGTGLMGGARSTRPGIVLDTVRLNAIDVQAGDRFVWAGAGAILADVDTALRKHGLCLGHDPWTFPVATVGGTLSTNSLGYKGGRYGGMGDQAIALEVALADGTRVAHPRRAAPLSTGPDLERLFIGAEGTLGVITAAALQAHAVPEATELRGYNFATFEDGFHAIDEHDRPGPASVAARLRRGARLALARHRRARGRAAASSTWASRAGARKSTPRSPAASASSWRTAGTSSRSRACRRFWDDRHVVAERFARTRRQRAQLAQPRRRVRLHTRRAAAVEGARLPRRPARGIGARARSACWSAACGRRRTSSQPCSPCRRPTTATRASRRPSMASWAQVQAFGGSMEYVHGAGLRYAHLMPQEHATDYEVLKRIKHVLDPNGVINPGKLGL